MLKKIITYTNPFTNQEVVEEHYFHISKATLVEMDMEEHKQEYTNKEGKKLTGMQAHLSRVVEAEDGKAIMAAFKDLIRRSYGKKDGDRFRQSSEIWDEFASSEAYSALFYELCTNPVSAAEFVNGIIPADLDQEAARLSAEAQKTADVSAEESSRTMDALINAANDVGDGDPTVRVLTRSEAIEMDAAELQSGLTAGHYKLS